jgi:hypothetical protein
MKITEYSPLSKSSATKKKSATSASGASGEFLGLLSADETESAVSLTPAPELQPVTSMDMLLSLQEIPDDEIKKRKAVVAESNGTLEALETLRLALLAGSVPEHLLHTLGKVVAVQKQRVDDPRLMSIIEDIELRAAVELAKLERASKHN